MIAYLRLSTDRQDAASQRQQIDGWLEKRGMRLHAMVQDEASGGTPWQKRRIAEVLATARAGDTIIVSEVSRIARSTQGVLGFLQAAAEKGVEVVAVQSGIRLDGTLSSKIAVTVLALAAEIERDLLRERTRHALAARRAAGVKLGRPAGGARRTKLEAKRSEIERCMAARVPLRAIARMVGCAPATLYAALDLWGMNRAPVAAVEGGRVA